MSIPPILGVSGKSLINLLENGSSHVNNLPAVPGNNYSKMIKKQSEKFEKLFSEKKEIVYDVVDRTFGLIGSGSKKMRAVDKVRNKVLQEIEFTHTNCINMDMEKSFPRLPKDYFDEKGSLKKITVINKLATNDENRKATLKMISYAVKDSINAGNEGRVISEIELSGKNKNLIILLKELGFELSNKNEKKFIDHFYLCNAEKFDGSKVIGVYLPKENVENLLQVTRSLDVNI